MSMTHSKSGGSKALASRPNLLNALRVQTSSYGQVVPILYGQNRISGRLIWSGDFTAIPHTSTQKVGGKGLGSGGGNAITNTTYTYQTAVAIALCSGPIQNIHNVFDSKGKLALVSTSQTITAPAGGGSVTVTPPGGGKFHSGFGATRADSFSVAANDFGSDGALTLTGTQQTPMLKVSSAPAQGQYTETIDPVAGTASYQFAAADGGQQITITYVYSAPDSNSSGVPQSKLALTLFTGSRPQSPWTYLTSRHPGQDLGYNGLAYVASSNMDLGESGTLPNFSFEVLGIAPFGGGITDAEPSAIISDLLNNPFYGLAGTVPLDSTTLAQYRNFCVANSIFLSPVLDSQRSAAQWLQDILDITNAAAVWSEGLLKIVSYGDTTAVGNGAVFTPSTQPIYDLSSNDFLAPVTLQRPSIADVNNSVSIEFLNRANDYNPEIAEDKDEAMIALYGLRKAEPKQAHAITSSTVARFVSNLLRKRSVEIRATYKLKLGWQFNLLEPMDLVTITVPELGYNKKPVRITAISEDDTGQLSIDAEDFPWSSSTPALYAQQPAAGFAPQANSDPGPVSAPIIFEANDRLSLTGNYEIWIGACGSGAAITGATNTSPIQITAPAHGLKTGSEVVISSVTGNTAANGTWNVTVIDPDNFALNGSAGNGAYISGGFAINGDWGGCTVWMSPDNQSYKAIGKMYGASRMGAVTNTLPAGTDPDTTHSINVDLHESLGSLSSGTQADCDNFRTLCWIGGELISYQSGTLTAPYLYTLGTRLRRGVFGSPNVGHSATPFLRLDDAVFIWEADPTLVGTTIYFKFTSFNKFGLMEQSLANATAYSFAFNGLFGNIGDPPANNATMESAFLSGAADEIRIYGPGGVGTSYTAWKADQSQRTVPAQTLTLDDSGAAIQISATYWITFDFNSQTHTAWFNFSDYVQAVGRGQMRLGGVTTVNSSGSGGSSGGGGGTSRGGAGRGNLLLPP